MPPRKPPASHSENNGREYQHLQDGDNTNAETRQQWHACRVAPAIEAIKAHPFHNYRNAEPGRQHQRVCGPSWLVRPV